MSLSSIHPSLILILGAVLVHFFSGKLRPAIALATPLLAYWSLLNLGEGTLVNCSFMGFELIPMDADRFSLIFAHIFIIACFTGIVFLLHQKESLEYSAGLFYAGSALGVVLAGDLLTLFAFWEMLTFGAVFLILARKTERAKAAALRYVLVHIVGGLTLLAGIILYMYEQDSSLLRFEQLGLSSLSTWLIFFGFGLNCSWPVLHAWLADTYPEASAGGVIFMATYTTKTAVYVLASAFAGEQILIVIGCIMAVFPLFYAVIENDLRKVLAYCLINQVGFMVIGIGIGSELALNGTAAHAFCHILYKSLLFMAMGAVLYRVGKIKCTELGGLYKSMPITTICCIIGALGMSFPLFCGFVSKSMLMSSVAYKGYPLVWLILLFASAGVFHVGIRIAFYAFFGKDAGHRVKEAPINMRIAMGLGALLCIFIGSAPEAYFYKLLPFQDAMYDPYTTSHVITQIQLLFFSALAFALLLLAGVYPAAVRSVNLDTDLLYRKPARLFYQVMDWSLNGLISGSYKLIILGWLAKVNHFFTEAPTQILSFFVRLFSGFAEPGNAKTAANESIVRERSDATVFPIGISICASIVVMIVLLLLSR